MDATAEALSKAPHRLNALRGDGHVTAHPGGDFGGSCANDASAEDDDFAGRHAVDPAQQDPRPPCGRSRKWAASLGAMRSAIIDIGASKGSFPAALVRVS